MYTRTDVCVDGGAAAERIILMIAYIKGELADISENEIVVESNNIGYVVNVPTTVIDKMPSIGCKVKVYTYMYVREDIMALYGFLSRDDLRVFKLLITVSGIGPKGALGILSTISPDDLRFAVLSGDAKTISKAPGIGAKTAQRLIIDLKDKLSLEEAFETKFEHQTAGSPSADASGKEEAVLALVALGYSQAEALKAVKASGASDDMNSDEVLKLALKKMMTF